MKSSIIDEHLPRFFANLEHRDELSAEEKSELRRAVSHVETYRVGEAIALAEEPQTYSRILLDGLAGRAKVLPDGARQITALHVAGEFVDLHSFLLKRLDQDVIALSPSIIAAVPHERLRVISETHPHLIRMLWLSTLIDASIHREWLVSSGRRSAVEQVAHLFCELIVRMQAAGLCHGTTLPLTLTQSELGDVCGLSTVHINRVAQELRASGLIEWTKGEVRVRNWEALAAFAQFDPAYLVLRREPR